MLRQQPSVQQGQNVRLVSRGPGFQVSAEGRALNTAADGQVAQVRTSTGQTISGIARTGGVVEVRY
jgi:flagella basal body P-ring formation protein FlgA